MTSSLIIKLVNISVIIIVFIALNKAIGPKVQGMIKKFRQRLSPSETDVKDGAGNQGKEAHGDAKIQ